jgi:FtsZ-interacting cell division protein YlmF
VTSLAAWGPTLVMAVAVLSAGAVSLRFAKGTRSVPNRPPIISERRSTALSDALQEAGTINAYSPDLSSEPKVYLRPIVRITPARYQEGVNEIPRHFDQGHVVSVDLGLMSASQAARLVDFCSGYLVGASGWMFRAADRVIVLTPVGRNVSDAIEPQRISSGS